MGTSQTYQAIPEGSELARLIEDDPKAAYLFSDLFSCGGGPCYWDQIRDEVEEDDIAERSGLYDSRADVLASFDNILAVIDRTRRAFPELEDRRVFLEKTQYDIRDALVRRLQESGKDETTLVDDLMFGVEDWRFDLKIIPRAVVPIASKLLEAVPPRSLFDPYRNDSEFEGYRDLRILYRETAESGDFIATAQH